MSDIARDNGLPPNFKEYEEGKRRRYELLFQVNGGAFAIVSLLGDPKTSDFVTEILGLRTLGIGMLLFTLVMGIDIAAFGWGMKLAALGRDRVERLRQGEDGLRALLDTGPFRIVGMLVLACIIALIAGGWACVVVNAPGAA